MAEATYDRSSEALGNIVEIAHVNTRVPDQRLSTLFYITGLGLTRDPYLNTGITNMWVNVGKSQFHLPTGEPQVLRGTTGLVIPGREALLARLAQLRGELKDTKFSFREANDGVETICPWGNRIVCHTPDQARFGRFQLAMPYVAFDVRPGAAQAIARFYREIFGTDTELTDDGRTARVHAGEHQHLVFRETESQPLAYDQHHIQIYICDFLAPYQRLQKLGLVTEESNRVQYRFQDIVDLDTRQPVFAIEHEVRSMTHPMYARPLVNRDPALSQRDYRHGHEDLAWASA